MAFSCVRDNNSNHLVGQSSLDKNDLTVHSTDTKTAVNNLANLKGQLLPDGDTHPLSLGTLP